MLEDLFPKKNRTIPVRVTPRFKEFLDDKRDRIIERGGPYLQYPELSDQILKEITEMEMLIKEKNIKLKFNLF